MPWAEAQDLLCLWYHIKRMQEFVVTCMGNPASRGMRHQSASSCRQQHNSFIRQLRQPGEGKDEVSDEHCTTPLVQSVTALPATPMPESGMDAETISLLVGQTKVFSNLLKWHLPDLKNEKSSALETLDYAVPAVFLLRKTRDLLSKLNIPVNPLHDLCGKYRRNFQGSLLLFRFVGKRLSKY